MRGLRHSLALLTVLGILSGSALAQGAVEEDAPPAALLKLAPEPARGRIRHARLTRRRETRARLSQS